MNTASLRALKAELQTDILKIMCDGAIQVDWRSLLDLQVLSDGRSLKETDDDKILRLAESLLRFGIVNNLQVWFDENGDCYCFDAHHRRKAFEILDKAGVEIPPLPATRCLASSKVQAMKLLLVKESKSSWVNYKVVPDYLQETGFSFKVASGVIDLPGIKWNELCEAGEDMEEEQEKADAIPEPPSEIYIKTGDLIELGAHRLLCGDSTKKEDVERLMAKNKAILLHADPPYGMGKEKDGVQNDNLYREKLDAFQMEWWRVFRPSLEDNASAYIWGNAEDLWRLWYCGGLKDSERVTFRNEIIWEKIYSDCGTPDAMAQGSDLMRSFNPATERCLFFMLGEQGFNNNADNYWEGWEPIRKYLKSECEKLGWNNKVVADFFGFHPRMADHWFSKSQWSFIQEDQYKKLQKAANGGAFKKDYGELKKEFYATRAYFDNTHENMTDVWQYQRVQGEERHGHATPKPVEMIERAIKSSSPEGAVAIEPFLGSGSTLIACEKTNRRCFAIEIDPQYCQVSVQRWADFTGQDEIKINGQQVSWSEYVGI